MDTEMKIPFIRRFASFMLLVALACSFALGGCGSEETADGYIPASSNLWSGVKLYNGDARSYAFEVLGGNENYQTASGASIRGVKVRYPSGSEEWKDRSYITGSDDYWVKSDDPALKAQKWQTLTN